MNISLLKNIYYKLYLEKKRNIKEVFLLAIILPIEQIELKWRVLEEALPFMTMF